MQTLLGPDSADLPSTARQGRMSPEELVAFASEMDATLSSADMSLNHAPVVDLVPEDRGRKAPIGPYRCQCGSTAEVGVTAACAIIDGLALHGPRSR